MNTVTTQATMPLPQTREEALTQAAHWLDMALRAEASGRSGTTIDTAIGRAVKLEAHAFTLPA